MWAVFISSQRLCCIIDESGVIRMAKKVMRLRDDIRKTFTAYALIPVFIISLISIALALAYWNKNVLERNRESRTLVCEALTTIVADYLEKEEEIAADCDLAALAHNRQAQMEMYQQLYAQINITHANADFYIVDDALQPLIASKKGRPDFLEIPPGAAWGIVGQLQRAPTAPALSFVGAAEALRDRNLAVGRAIVRDGRIRGYVFFVIPGAYLLKAIANPYVQFVICDPYDYTPLATNYAFSNDTMNKLQPQLRGVEGYFSHEHQQYYMTRQEILDQKLTVYAVTPISGMVSQYATAVLILLGVLFILAVTVVIRVKRETVAKTIVIDRLVEAFEAAQKGDLDTRLFIRTNNEFEIIAEAYNTMLDSFKDLMRLNNEKVRETVISEIKQLESQFNPHFLFNPLENVRVMIKLDPAAAGRMIVALSALLRYSIDNKIGEVTVEEDMTYTQNYLDIQKMRFGDRLDYSVRVEDTVRACVVPKLIFQPIIENAIKYGAADGSKIRIEMEIWRQEEHLEIIVFNSGSGMAEKELAEIRAILAADVNVTQHTGLHNVNRRIRLIYGAPYGVEISSEKRAGTTVRIVLPLRA